MTAGGSNVTFSLDEIVLVSRTSAVTPSTVLAKAPQSGNGMRSQGVTLGWSNSSDAISYRLQVSLTPGFESTLIDERDVHDTSICAAVDGNGTFYWRVRGENGSSVGEYSGVGMFSLAKGTLVNSGLQGVVPSEFSLEQNYPNPFNPETRIRYAVPSPAHVTLTVFDAAGRLVSKLVDGEQTAGMHEVRFGNSALSTGLYLYRLTAVDENGTIFNEIKKMMLLR
jgi:hypothetical protein